MQSEKIYCEWKAINITKFSKQNQNRFVMQLAVMLNDLNSIGEFNKLLNELESRTEKIGLTAYFALNWLDGLRLYILRQNVLALFEGMQAIDFITDKVEKINNQGKSKKGPTDKFLLWELIAQDATLLGLLKELNSYLRIDNTHQGVQINELDVDKAQKKKSLRGFIQVLLYKLLKFKKPEEIKRTPFYETMAYIRNKIGGHVDNKALKTGIHHLLSNNIDEGFIVKREDEGSFRALFIDNVVTNVWKKKIVECLCPVSNSKADNDKFMHEDYPRLVGKVKELAGGFAYLLLVKYVTAAHLTVELKRENALAEELVNFSYPAKA